MLNNIELGRIGEDAAVKLLEAKGYEVLERNYRRSCGEIDIIAEKDAEISFIEVKTRRNADYGRPCESVDYRKQRHIRDTAIFYLREDCAQRGGYARMNFDVIEIMINHIKGSF